MATKKASHKNNKKVDAILVLLIAIIVVAVITLGIVLIISFNTPDVIEPDRNPGLVTDTSGTYANYLSSTMENGSKTVPVAGYENATEVVLGTDNNLYVVLNGDNPDEIPGASKNGTKVAGLENVVDVWGLTPTEGSDAVFALTLEGKLYIINVNDPTGDIPTHGEYSCGKEVVEVYITNGEMFAKLFDNSTMKITDEC